jgi:hypothetical protein
MALMIPDLTVEEVERENGSNAEARIYAAIGDGLGAGYTVLYSVAWLEKGRAASPQEGEADFLVLHPDRGLLVIEVKGGGVERNPAGEGWITRGADGIHRMRDPFVQARSSMHALLRKLDEAKARIPAEFTIGYAVMMPDVFRHGALMGPSAPPEITLFADDVDDLGSKIESLFDYWSPDHPGRGFDTLGEDGMESILSVLAPIIKLETSLGSRIQGDNLRFSEATSAQLSILRGLNRNRRASVVGAAGTGKTALALEKAKQLSAEGFETLLTCFNRPLIEHLERRCEGIQGLTVRTFHDHGVQMARAASLPMPELDGKDSPSRSFWDEGLPALMLEALELLPGHRFDAVVIDEAQDVPDEWHDLLELCLRDPESAVFYVFEDPSQAIYQEAPAFSSSGVVFDLPANLRNTRAIHEAAMQFYDGVPTECLGPPGEPVQKISISNTDALPAELGKLLHRLVVEQDVKAEDIVILSHRSTFSSALSPGDRLGSFELVPVGRADTRKVEFESAWRFKGLERPVVILVEVRPDADTKIRYSAMTRARSHLVLVGTENELAGFST